MTSRAMYRAGTELVIDPQSRKIHFYVGSELKKTYPVGVGKPATPTPAGDYKVVNKALNPGGVLGTRWMGLNVSGGNYGIHGTNNPVSIGNLVSLGCIRMQNYNVEELFPQVPIGTPVRILAVPGYNQKGSPVPGSKGEGPPLDHSIYQVQPGDTLWKLAQKFNVSLDTLIAANNIVNPNHLEVGQTIYLPK